MHYIFAFSVFHRIKGPLQPVLTFRLTVTFSLQLHINFQGPVVQSIVSLTSSLRGQLVKSFSTL